MKAAFARALGGMLAKSPGGGGKGRSIGVRKARGGARLGGARLGSEWYARAKYASRAPKPPATSAAAPRGRTRAAWLRVEFDTAVLSRPCCDRQLHLHLPSSSRLTWNAHASVSYLAGDGGSLSGYRPARRRSEGRHVRRIDDIARDVGVGVFSRAPARARPVRRFVVVAIEKGIRRADAMRRDRARTGTRPRVGVAPARDRVAPAPTLADAIDPPETALVTLARRHVARRYDRESARHLLGSLQPPWRRPPTFDTTSSRTPCLASPARRRTDPRRLPRRVGRHRRPILRRATRRTGPRRLHRLRVVRLGRREGHLAVHAAASAVPDGRRERRRHDIGTTRVSRRRAREEREETDAKTMRTNAAEAARNARRRRENNVVAAEGCREERSPFQNRRRGWKSQTPTREKDGERCGEEDAEEKMRSDATAVRSDRGRARVLL